MPWGCVKSTFYSQTDESDSKSRYRSVRLLNDDATEPAHSRSGLLELNNNGIEADRN